MISDVCKEGLSFGAQTFTHWEGSGNFLGDVFDLLDDVEDVGWVGLDLVDEGFDLLDWGLGVANARQGVWHVG